MILHIGPLFEFLVEGERLQQFQRVEPLQEEKPFDKLDDFAMQRLLHRMLQSANSCREKIKQMMRL